MLPLLLVNVVSSTTFLTIGVTTVASYLWLVRRLRWRRYDAIHAKFQTKFDEGKLTVRDAQEILAVSMFYDMPMLMNYSLAFALFKTFAIPSISSLLAHSKELTDTERVSKRYTDTELLICSWMAFPIPGDYGEEKGNDDALDPRAMIALARTNWLHSQFNIKNDDYLYTLSLFVLEPWRWAERYGWRPLSPMEIHSYFLLWQEIGKRMNIQDVPDTFEEMLDWSLKYEEKMMVPAKTNHQVSTATTNELLHAAPEALGIKAFLRRITACLVEDRVRTAMMLEEQPTYLHVLTRSTLLSVKYFQKYLCLPRSKKEMITPQDFPAQTPGSLARLTPTRYAARPWYRPQRTGLGSLLDKLLVVVGFHDDLPQPKYRSEGYRIEEIGPLKYEQQGHDEVFRMAEKLQACPITGVFSRDLRPTGS